MTMKQNFNQKRKWQLVQYRHQNRMVEWFNSCLHIADLEYAEMQRTWPTPDFSILKVDESIPKPLLVRTGLAAEKYGHTLHHIFQQYDWKQLIVLFNENVYDQEACFSFTVKNWPPKQLRRWFCSFCKVKKPQF